MDYVNSVSILYFLASFYALKASVVSVKLLNVDYPSEKLGFVVFPNIMPFFILLS